MMGSKIGTQEILQPQVRPVNWSMTVAFMFIANVIMWADRSNFSIAAAVWQKQFSWAPAVLGIMLSTFQFGYWLMQPLGGWLSDKVGPRRMLGASAGGWSLFTLLTPIAPTVLWLTGTFRVLLGITEAPFLPSTASAVARAVPTRLQRGRYNAFIQSASSLGPALGTFFGAILAHSLGVSWIFIVFGGVGVILAIVWLNYASPRSDPEPTMPSNRDEEQQRASEPTIPISRMLSSGRVWAFIIPYFALPYCQFMFLAWLPTYFVKYRHIHLVEAGFLSALPFIVAFFAGNFAGWASDGMTRLGWTWGDLNRKLFIYLGAIIFAVSILVAATTPSVGVAVAMIILANVGLQFFVMPYWIMVTDMSPRQSGTLTGFMNFFGILGATIAPTLTGFLIQSTHSFVLPFRVAAVIMIAATIVIAFFVRIRPLSQLVTKTAK